jgi:two-component system response regulator NreC
MKKRVLIVDDHHMFRDGLKALISRQKDMEIVMDGAEATRQILAEMPDMKILALSIQAEDGFMARMIRAGAQGYILKGCDSDELLSIIRRTLQAPGIPDST